MGLILALSPSEIKNSAEESFVSLAGLRIDPTDAPKVQHPKVLNLVPRGLIEGDCKSFVI